MDGYVDDVDTDSARLCKFKGSNALAALTSLTVSELHRSRAICCIALPALAKVLGDSLAPFKARQHAVKTIAALAREHRLQGKLCSNADITAIAALSATQLEAAGLGLNHKAARINEFSGCPRYLQGAAEDLLYGCSCCCGMCCSTSTAYSIHIQSMTARPCNL